MASLHNRIDRRILKKRLENEETARVTISFYQYAHILNPSFFRDHLYFGLDKLRVFGRIYIANEGVNAQISVPESNLDDFRQCLNQITFLKDIRLNRARQDDGKSFYKLIIKLKAKIVADGLQDETFDVTAKGTHLSAQDFNQITSEEETVLVDMRNHYESEVGHFKGAITPDVETFRESLPKIAKMLESKKENKLVMYCTGGIRCEKASAYMKHQGFKNVFQLEGGIIEYARQVESEGLENKFLGKNFVFDDRLGERISSDIISKCHQCGADSDLHVNCLNDACHILFIQCESCQEKMDHCCSNECQSFIALPKEEQARLKPKLQFNGTKFGKGRYKAARKGDINPD